MFVRDKMNSEVITIAPDQNLRMARERMHKHRVRRLPVVEHGKLVGIVTDRDVRQAWASPATSLSVHELLYLLDHVTVAEVMTWKTFTVTADTPLVEAARLLHDHKIGGLPVVEGSAVVGMITETDLLEALIEMFETDQEVLAAIGRSQGHTEAMTMVAIIPNPLDPKAS
jgi:acetoin utilization protein AcuB